jgi:xylulokinase
MKLTGHITTTVSALSEAVCWDFRQKKASIDLFNYFGIDESLIPEIQPVFAEHGRLSAASSKLLSLREGIPVSYKAGDQLNNALSLDVLEPGEVAANAGTSGVIYGITDKLEYDKDSRVNSFAHVNYRPDNHTRIGVLLCINGTGIMNRWIKQLTGNDDYNSMNNQAEIINTGSDGLLVLPFGNGAERMLGNKTPGAQILGIDLNIHGKAHVFRAVQEGIVFSFRYGLDILRSNGLHPSVIRAGNSNMFLSSLFCKAFVNCLQTPLELYDTDGSTGAAIGAGIGAGFFTAAEAFGQLKPLQRIEPIRIHEYEIYYGHWLHGLKKFID